MLDGRILHLCPACTCKKHRPSLSGSYAGNCCNLHAPLCGIFHPNSVAVARYGALIRAKSPTNCDAHLAESLFQTRSRRYFSKRADARLLNKISAHGDDHIISIFLLTQIVYLVFMSSVKRIVFRNNSGRHFIKLHLKKYVHMPFSDIETLEIQGRVDV